MNVRDASINDIPELVPLMEQLGYPTSVDKFKKRFNAIAENSNYRTFVAEMNGKVVGMAGSCLGMFYEHDGSYVQIIAFVVDTNYRRKGIGEKLIQAVENWAKTQGAMTIALNSGSRLEREGAHQFYSNMGFISKSIGLQKSLSN